MDGKFHEKDDGLYTTDESHTANTRYDQQQEETNKSKQNKKNIIYIGSDSYYKDNLKLSKVNNKECNLSEKDDKYLHLEKIDKLEDIKGKQGFLLVLTLDELYYYFPDIIDIYKPDVYEIDRHVRKIFHNFQYVIILSVEEFDYGHIPFSNIYVEFANKYFNTTEGINLLIDKLYKEFPSKKEEKLSRIKIANIEKLKTYIKQKEFITTKEIIDNLNVNEKWIQRHMKYMNSLYNNIGYNKRKRVWYTVKNNYKL